MPRQIQKSLQFSSEKERKMEKNILLQFECTELGFKNVAAVVSMLWRFPSTSKWKIEK